MTRVMSASTISHRFPSQKWDVSFRQMDDLYADFEALGLGKLGASRIGEYRKAYQWFESIQGKDKSHLDLVKMEKLLHTLVEFQELRTIVAAARGAIDKAHWHAQLKTLISGHPFPDCTSQQSSARDFQFECYLGAVCALSGYKVRFDEPDVVVEDGSCIFGLAAKRPRNLRKIEANCRKAVHQIECSGRSGLVALDLSLSLYPKKCINTNDVTGAVALLEAATQNFAQQNLTWLTKVCQSHHSFGVLLTIHLPVLIFDSPVPRLATSKRWEVMLLCSPTDSRVKWGLEFASRCELGLFGPRSPNELEEFNS